MKVAYPAGAWPRARCCPLGAASPALRPKLPSPVLKCHRRSAVAAPWKHSLACFGSPAAPRTAPRGPLVGVAVRSGADLGPLSDHSIGDSSRPGPHSHGGGRGRGRGREWVRHGYSHQETARQWSDGRGRGWVSDGGWKPGARSPAPAQGEPHARPAVDAPGGYRNRGRAADIKGGVRPNGGSGGYVRLSELRHLGELQEAVGRLAGRWAAKGDFGTLVAAFSYTCKVGTTVCDIVTTTLLLLALEGISVWEWNTAHACSPCHAACLPPKAPAFAPYSRDLLGHQVDGFLIVVSLPLPLATAPGRPQFQAACGRHPPRPPAHPRGRLPPAASLHGAA